MFFRDAFRAQYYLSSLEKEIVHAQTCLSSLGLFSNSLGQILSDFATELGEEIDQILLPTISFELHKAKKKNFLIGETPSARYKVFLFMRKITQNWPLLYLKSTLFFSKWSIKQSKRDF